MRIPKNRELKNRSTFLRNNPTREEKQLWYKFLRTYPVQFNRQRIIGNYIVDFYCPKAKLVIELDGHIHYQDFDTEYDLERTRFFEYYGIKIIRFSNKSIWQNFSQVCTMIDYHVNSRIIQR